MTRFRAAKLAVGLIVLAVAASGIWQMYAHKNYGIDTVLGPGVTRMGMLSDYHASLKGTAGDTRVFVLEGRAPGATMLVFGGTHSDEVAASIDALILIENAVVEQGTLIVVPMINNSGSRTTRPGEGQPLYFSIPTEWGEKTFRLGSRSTSQAHQWPDPEVYVHYPSRQMLAEVESRNVNRSWPGRADGSLTQQVTFAITQLMANESVDLALDLHMGSTMFPVNNCIIASESGVKIAAYASALLNRYEGVVRPVEKAPVLYRGLFNREIDEYVEGVCPFLMEVPVPFCDLPTGPKTEDLLLTGKDPFLLRLSQLGRLYARYDENGWPLAAAVGQHSSAILRLMEAWTMFNRDKPIAVTGVPTYNDVLEMGLGHYFADPSANPPDRVVKN